MGCDGGSIPTRRDLVKTVNKSTREHHEPSIERWFFCALSDEPLHIPIVSCSMGRLYNKEAVLRYLLEKRQRNKNYSIVEHINSLRDVTTLNLTPNTVAYEQRYTNQLDRVALFICPITRKEMSKCRFIYLKPCGCVFSEQAIKENSERTCLLCNTSYNSIVVLNEANIEHINHPNGSRTKLSNP